MELVDVNTTAAREHVGKIERGIRYLKERCRCSVSTFAIAGIKFLAKPIVIQVVYNITVLVNAVPDPLGVSKDTHPVKLSRNGNLTSSGSAAYNLVPMYRQVTMRS